MNYLKPKDFTGDSSSNESNEIFDDIDETNIQMTLSD